MPNTTRADEVEPPARGTVRIGCAGWSLPRAHWPHFPSEGTHLERYAARLNAVEINSSFHRPHRREVYARWADSSPATFRFSVKLPKAITHEARLAGCEEALERFLMEAGGLGEKFGCLLVQLPPSLAFDPSVAEGFFRMLRDRHPGDVALEPRHASWFRPDADARMGAHRIARVLADPVLQSGGELPGGWSSLVYLRLHGSPRTYWSAYTPDLLANVAERLARAVATDAAGCWCIFDNTAGGEATGNAVALEHAIGSAPGRGSTL